jgi:phosphatidylinositol-3-phosphatase
MNLKMTALALGLAAIAVGPAMADDEDRNDHAVPRFDHVFVIMMENHAFDQIISDAHPEIAPFINSYAKSANLATNYFGVGHPSLTNYLEIVGGSNFGVINDFSPDWHNTHCTPNIVSHTPALEDATADICPIAGTGVDGETPAVDTTNEGTPSSPVYNDYLAPARTVGKMIGDQLVEAGLSWLAYQENLPPYGADYVNNSDGLISDITAQEPGMPKLYAVKHNPFVYFASVQAGSRPQNGLKNIVGFDRLYADLASGHVPNFSFISPNQCHDQHARGSSEVGTGCSVDANAILQGDAALQTLVTAIKGSAMWKKGNNVIVTVWDENDYGTEPNQVVTIVDTSYGPNGVHSNRKYNHFSLLKTLEAGFGLDYLNHAGDKNVHLMSDLFGH